MNTNDTSTLNVAKQTVLSFIDALNNEAFKTARQYAADDFRFEGVLGSRNGADAYFADMEKMKLKYDVKKSFENGNDVCLLYDVKMSGINIFGCGWYQLQNNKIVFLKVVFDPRPVLAQADKNKAGN